MGYGVRGIGYGGIKIILRDKLGQNQTFFVFFPNKTTATRQETCENACNIFCSLPAGEIFCCGVGAKTIVPP
jgi:hypothetical protein